MYYGTEAYIAIFFIAILSYMAARILFACFVDPFIVYVKGLIQERKESKYQDVSVEDLQAFLEQVDFENMVREYAEGLHDNDPIPETDPYIEFEIPCAGYDCALSPQREDACKPEWRTERDGKVYCRIKFNLNKLVEEGKEEYAYPTSNPNLLTPEELKMFNDWYLKFTKYLESNKNQEV